MCNINWLTLLEYLKVLLSWPPIVLIISLIAFSKFHDSIKDLMRRVIEGSFLGNSFKATPQLEQQLNVNVESKNDPNLASIANTSPIKYNEQDELPPELTDDPLAKKAIDFVKENPVQTVIEYKNLSKYYGFERTFNLIYGTQVSILEFLSTAPDKIFSQEDLVSYYHLHQSLANNHKSSVDDYFNFLIRFGLLISTGPSDKRYFQISHLGREFLVYIKKNYSLIWNGKAF